jgi:hypothetical protein
MSKHDVASKLKQDLNLDRRLGKSEKLLGNTG